MHAHNHQTQPESDLSEIEAASGNPEQRQANPKTTGLRQPLSESLGKTQDESQAAALKNHESTHEMTNAASLDNPIPDVKQVQKSNRGSSSQVLFASGFKTSLVRFLDAKGVGSLSRVSKRFLSPQSDGTFLMNDLWVRKFVKILDLKLIPKKLRSFIKKLRCKLDFLDL